MFILKTWSNQKIIFNKLFLLGFFLGQKNKNIKPKLTPFILGRVASGVLFNTNWCLFMLKKALYFFRLSLRASPQPTVLVVDDNLFLKPTIAFKKLTRQLLLAKKKVAHVYFFYKGGVWSGGELSNLRNKHLFPKKKGDSTLPMFVVILHSKHYREIAVEARSLGIFSIGFVDVTMDFVFDYNIPLGTTNVKNTKYLSELFEQTAMYC